MAFTLRQVSTYTLADSVASQKAFNANTTGEISLVPGHYEFEWFMSVSAMSATSGNALLSLLGAGTATLARQLWNTVGFDGSAMPTSPGAISASFQASNATTAAAVTAATSTAMHVKCSGRFDCTVAGTIIPSLTLLTGGVTPIVAAGSYFTVKLLSQATGQTIYDDGGFRTTVSEVLVPGVTNTITYNDGTVRVDKL